MSQEVLTKFQAKCKAFFEQADENGDGLTVVELGRVLRATNKNFSATDKEIVQMFMEVDDDGDKKITWEEFSDALFKRDPKEVHQAELAATFEKFDKDGSGKISKAELKGVIESMGYTVSEEGLQSIMDAADPDDNGVDFQEFLKTWNGGQ